MLLKILAIAVVLFLVYVIFFKKSRDEQVEDTKRTKKRNQEIEDEMFECPTCKTFVSKNEAILSNGNYYCSKECLNK